MDFKSKMQACLNRFSSKNTSLKDMMFLTEHFYKAPTNHENNISELKHYLKKHG